MKKSIFSKLCWKSRTVSCKSKAEHTSYHTQSESHSVGPDSASPWTIQYSSWNSPGQNSGVGSLSLLQGIFPTQGLNPGLSHGRKILYQPSHKTNSKLAYRQTYVCEKSLSPVRLCDPTDCSPPGSSVHGIFQSKILEWVAISFSMGSSQPRDRTWVSCIAGQTLYHLNNQGGDTDNFKTTS